MHFGYLLPLILLISIAAHAETLTGTVVGVADGDTVTVLDANHQQYKRSGSPVSTLLRKPNRSGSDRRSSCQHS